MRRPSILWSLPTFATFALAAACGASQDAAPPAAAPPPPATASIPAAPVTEAHAPTPPVAKGVEAQSIDASVAPCDDFFQYACGGWLKAHPIPDDRARWGRFDSLAEQNETSLRAILEHDQTSPSKDDAFSKQLGDFYGSCVDEDTVERDGLKSIAADEKRIAAVSDPASLARALAHLHLTGIAALFEVGEQQDFKDATQVIGAIDQDGLGMPDRDYYLKDDAKTVEVRAKYLAHMERMFALLGDKPEVAKKNAASVLAFEKSLAEAQISRVEHRDPQKIYHRMTRADLAKASPKFAWDVYFKELGFPKIEAINVLVPEYVSAIDKRLAGATKATWSDEIRPYLRWQLVHAYAPDLAKRFVDEDFTYKKELTGAEKNEPRWKRCVRTVDRAMGEALAIPFVKAKLGAEGKTVTKEMVQQVEASMQKDLEQLPWMDEATRSKAADKVHKLFNKIGYPDKWKSYEGLVIDKKSLATNVMRASELEAKRDLAKIGKPVDRGEWHMTPPTVNAYYNPSLNEMVFPAGILQAPFFGGDRPLPVNFGGVGAVMGHELTHGFDDKGRQFDGDGNLKDWWTPSVSTEFDKRAQCVVDQFDSYVAVDDLHLNGKLTLGENIADLGGIKLAMASLHAKGEDSAEADRAFFTGFAQVWCGEMRPEMARVRVRTDPHSPPRWRVNGTLSNVQEFSKAFSCRAGDAMVRSEEKRCTVW